MGTFKLPESELSDRFAKLRERGITVIGEYKTTLLPLHVRCVCGHEWERTASKLFRGHGCKICSSKKRGISTRCSGSELRNRYDKLSERGITVIGEFAGARSRVRAHCICGHEWWTQVGKLFRGSGCEKCGFKKISSANRMSESNLSQRYSELSQRGITVIGEYTGVENRLFVRCIRGHQWSPKASNLFRGTGCPRCAIYGFQEDKAAILYYVRISNPFGEPIYKIGITNRTVYKRFEKDHVDVVIIETWHFENGGEAYEMEQDILNDYDADRYTGPDILRDGNDELFTIDVLGLDKGAGQLELVA